MNKLLYTLKFVVLFASFSLVLNSCDEEIIEPTFDLIAPFNLNITQVSSTAFRAEWNSVEGADFYYTTVSTDEAFTEVLATYDELKDSRTGMNVINLESDTEYFIKVRTEINGELSDYTEALAVTTAKVPDGEPGLFLKEQTTEFAIGMAVSTPKLGGQYDAIYKNEFNSLTAEYEMKMNFMMPSEGTYDFSKADAIVDYAVANNMHVHGHSLIWHNSSAVPGWVNTYSGTDQEFEDLMEDYVKTTVERYKGKVRSWDVVNEVFEDGSGALRNSVFKQKMGDDFVEKCYKWTREADPDVLIFYNDYNMVIDDTKRGAALAMVDDFLERGVPIDGFGFQMHIGYNGPSKAKIASTAKEVTDRGLLLHFSELDVRANPSNNLSSLSEQRAVEQQQKVKEVVEVYNAIPDASKFALTIWGLRDTDSWLLDFWGQPDWPLLYDQNYEVKKAHTGFLQGLE